MARRALLVGINSYDNAGNLSARVADAQGIAEALTRHKDGRLNYEWKVLLDRTEGHCRRPRWQDRNINTDGLPKDREELREKLDRFMQRLAKLLARIASYFEHKYIKYYLGK